LLVPLASCSDAAGYLIEALGGEEEAARFVGGTRWWQVRGLEGIDANWIAEKRDIDAMKKARGRSSGGASGHRGDLPHDPKRKENAGKPSKPFEMDDMLCMYYLHGGKLSLALQFCY
jgi:hypothetical protein